MPRVPILLIAAAAIVAVAALAGCGSGGSVATSAGTEQMLTLWENFGPLPEAEATRNLAAAFEKDHPNITIKVESQPESNYFALLQASAVSHTGPDLAVMWTGQFTLKYAHLLENLKGHIPDSDLARMDGLKWASPDFDESKGTFVVPLENQFYMAFYNKAAMHKAGIDALPRTWDDLYEDCSKLKGAGYTPLVYGNSNGSLGAEFYPWYDMSYTMIGAYPLSAWKGLYDGSTPWTDEKNVAQLEAWHKMYTEGCTNEDVITNGDNESQFESGKAAITVGVNAQAPSFAKALGKDLGVMAPPFSTEPIHGISQLPGDGYSVLADSQHKDAAYEFLQFMTTPQAGEIEDAAGLIPDIEGVVPTAPVNAEMVAYVTEKHYDVYPFLDNVIQTEVVEAGNKVIPTVLPGTTSAQSALSTMEQALESLPADQRSPESYK